MQIVVNNIARQQEIDPIAIGFKQRVLETMKKQIKKKLQNNQHEKNANLFVETGNKDKTPFAVPV